jgi:hypothetical protein
VQRTHQLVVHDWPTGSQAAETATLSVVAPSGPSTVAFVSPSAARLPAELTWDFMRSIVVTRRESALVSLPNSRVVGSVVPKETEAVHKRMS